MKKKLSTVQNTIIKGDSNIIYTIKQNHVVQETKNCIARTIKRRSKERISMSNISSKIMSSYPPKEGGRGKRGGGGEKRGETARGGRGCQDSLGSLSSPRCPDLVIFPGAAPTLVCKLIHG